MLRDGLGCGSVVEGLCSMFETSDSILNTGPGCDLMVEGLYGMFETLDSITRTAQRAWLFPSHKKNSDTVNQENYFLNDYQIHMPFVAS